MGKEINKVSRKAVNAKLKTFDCFAKDEDFVEVTEWSNGDGFDISFNEQVISLSYGQRDALNYLVDTLQHGIE